MGDRPPRDSGPDDGAVVYAPAGLPSRPARRPARVTGRRCAARRSPGQVGGAHDSRVDPGSASMICARWRCAPRAAPFSKAARAGPSSRLPGVGHAAADDEAARVEDGRQIGQALAEPAAHGREARSAATGSPSRAAWVTCEPVIPSGLPPASWSSRTAPAPGERRANSRASATRALPLAYCSQQPRLPHPH